MASLQRSDISAASSADLLRHVATVFSLDTPAMEQPVRLPDLLVAAERAERETTSARIDSAVLTALAAAFELGRRNHPVVLSRQLASPEAVVAVCGPLMESFDREHFWVLSLSTKAELLARDEVSVGTLDATVVGVPEVFRAPLIRGARSVVVLHNHPSGDPEPSRNDVRLTQRLGQAGEVLGIPLLDHLIIGHGGRYRSLCSGR